MASSTLNPAILEPLFAPSSEPNAHRVRAEKAGDPEIVVTTPIPLSDWVPQKLRIPSSVAIRQLGAIA